MRNSLNSPTRSIQSLMIHLSFQNSARDSMPSYLSESTAEQLCWRSAGSKVGELEMAVLLVHRTMVLVRPVSSTLISPISSGLSGLNSLILSRHFFPQPWQKSWGSVVRLASANSKKQQQGWRPFLRMSMRGSSALLNTRQPSMNILPSTTITKSRYGPTISSSSSASWICGLRSFRQTKLDIGIFKYRQDEFNENFRIGAPRQSIETLCVRSIQKLQDQIFIQKYRVVPGEMFLKGTLRLARMLSEKSPKQPPKSPPKDYTLLAVGPLDGRYSPHLASLSEYFSEYALMKYRLKVELEWLKFLFREGMTKQPSGKPFEISPASIATLDKLHRDFTPVECQRVKAIELTTNHDVKALEYYIKEKLESFSDLREVKQYVHFCCTSEDINNISYALILTAAKDRFLIPTYDAMTQKLVGMAKNWADIPMLSRTHGQAASPTTIGKEIANFTYRVGCQVKLIKEQKFAAKLNGAVGNFNAHLYAYPEFDWPRLSKSFLTGIGLDFNPYTTQIEPHDGLANFYSLLAHVNTILIAMSRDFWMYTSMGYFKQKVKKGQIGSSTMPHKVNPIDFENAQGNLGLANSLANHFSAKLPISRMQRDLSDSTVLRNQGLAFGYSILAYNSLLKGFDKVEVDREATKQDLNNHFEVVTEAVQTLLRKYGWQNPYELLKEMSRGKAFSRQDLNTLIDKLRKEGLTEQQLEPLKKIDPSSYIGNAAEMARNIDKYL